MRKVAFAGTMTGFICAMAATVSAHAGPKEEMMATDRAFSAMSVAEGNDAAFSAFIANDVRLFGTGNRPPIFGKAAFEKQAGQGPSNGDPSANVLSWEPDHGEVAQDGSMGTTDGRWTFTATSKDGTQSRLSGHYLTVWRKTADGWKVIADMGTADPSPAKK